MRNGGSQGLSWTESDTGDSSSLWFNIFLGVLCTLTYDNLCPVFTSLWQEQNTYGDSWLNRVAVWLTALLSHLLVTPLYVSCLHEFVERGEDGIC